MFWMVDMLLMIRRNFTSSVSSKFTIAHNFSPTKKKLVLRHASTGTGFDPSKKSKQPLVGHGRPTIISTGLLHSIQDRKRLIGCNIYVTAGGDQRHVPILTDVVQRTQNLFVEKSSKEYVQNLPNKSLLEVSEDEMERSLIERDEKNRYDLGILVHVFTDRVYNRTSFHLAGTPEIILDVTSDLIEQVVVELRKLSSNKNYDNDENSQQGQEVLTFDKSTEHPNIGLVDHVAVVPIVTGMEAQILDPYTTFSPPCIATHGADVARKLGKIIRDKLNVHVFYYGLAHKKKISLVKVRKRRTNFFQSGGQIVTGSMEPEFPTIESCTVGAPEEFVENYNIRLKESVSKKTAQYLSRLVREKDGGLDGVEALAFPYTNNRWEVACNLLRPYAGGANVEKLKDVFRDWNGKKDVLEKGYRVGTTQEQTIKVLEHISRSASNRKDNDDKVMTTFQSYFKKDE